MTIPTPSDFAKLQTQRKQQEQQRKQESAELEKKLKASSAEKHERTVKKNRARFGSGKERGSSPHPSSRKGKVPATSSKSEAMKNHPAGKNLSPSGNENSSAPASTPEKKVFVRKPHLTQRLSDNEKLKELRDSFPKPRHQNRSNKPRTGSTSKKK